MLQKALNRTTLYPDFYPCRPKSNMFSEEIQFVLDREEIVDCFQDLLRSGKISFRVTHNDTKINNVLMDKDTKKGICVIDLDTVMPGAAMNDFGDAVRIGASTALDLLFLLFLLCTFFL